MWALGCFVHVQCLLFDCMQKSVREISDKNIQLTFLYCIAWMFARGNLWQISHQIFLWKALANSCLYALFMLQAIIKIWQWFTVSQDFLHNSDQFFKSFIVRCNWQVKLADWLSRKIQQRSHMFPSHMYSHRHMYSYVFICIWQWFSDSLLKFGSDLWRFSFGKHSHHTAV